MERPRVLVTRRLPSAVIARLEERCDLDVCTSPDGLDADALRSRAADKHGLVCVLTDRVNETIFDAAPALKVVATIAVGYDNIDVAAARRRGVVVTNTPDVLTEAVAEFTWGLILAATRRIAEGDRLVRRQGWQGWTLDFMLGTQLAGKQLGVVGFGRIGRAVAARAPAFGMRVAYTGRSTSRDGAVAGATRLSFDEVLVTSDVVTLHLPLTPDSRHLIDQRALARMKRSAYLINTARGPIVDEAALAWALREGLLGGAALDVYEREPAVTEELLALDNVVLAPHLGSATRETRTGMADLAARNVLAVLAGEAPLTPVAGPA